MNVGDIYFWSWKEIRDSDRLAGTTYWASDRYCVAVEDYEGVKRLIDTYSYNEHVEYSLFDYESLDRGCIVDPEEVELKYLGNVSNYRKVNKADIIDYKSDDVLAVPCHKGYRTVFMVKKNASKDVATMINNLKGLIEDKECVIRCATIDIENYKRALKNLEDSV